MSVLPKIVRKAVRSIGYRSAYLSNNRWCSSEIFNEDCLKSQYPDINIPEISLAEYLVNNFRKYPDKIAAECGVTQRRYTYDELLVKATNLDKNLRKRLKLQRGDVVALILPNIPEFFVCALAVMLAGLKLTTINPIYTPDEIKRQLLDSNPKILITLPSLWKNAQKAVKETRNSIGIITIKHETSDTTPAGAIDFQELANVKCEIPDAEPTSLHETVFLPYSSGTTGLPKGVELTNNNIVSNLCQLQFPDFKVTCQATDTDQDVTVAVLPLFHIYGSILSLSMMMDGVKAVTLPKFTPDGYINCLRDYRPHVLMLVPPIVIFLYSHPSVKTEYLSSLRTINSGAAPLGASDEQRIREKVGKPLNITQGYGLSETSPVITMVPLKLQGKYPGSVGLALPNTLIKIVEIDDQQAKHLGPHKIGELLVKGPQVMKGYHNKPEETKNTFLNGWLKTGDLLRYDEDGMFYVADRIKELIKVKGFQVAPAELEEILRDFPGVSEAAVVGIPHQKYGEVPRAYIVPKIDSRIDVKRLKEYVDKKVSKHKRLEGGVAIVSNIPKNPSGKILRRQLKLQHLEQGV